MHLKKTIYQMRVFVDIYILHYIISYVQNDQEIV